MAQRRMFSPEIVCSDVFLEMPVSARDLYFQLGMKADDDGFISPRGVMRMLGAGEDDLKVLLAKRFVLPFESGVVVIKHWLIHNLIRADLYRETLYKKEKATLGLNENGAYTEFREGISPLKSVEAPKWLVARRGVRTANVPQTALRIGKDRLVSELTLADDTELEKKPKTPPKYPHSKEVFSWFPKPERSWQINTTECKHAELLFERGEEAVKKYLRYAAAHKDDDHFYQITKPSDLERKWEDIKAYAKRNS